MLKSVHTHTWLRHKQTERSFLSEQKASGVMASFHLLLIVSSLLPLVLSYPFIPPTCYSKVLSMARELSQWAAELKRGYETVSQLLVCHFAFCSFLHLYIVSICCNVDHIED